MTTTRPSPPKAGVASSDPRTPPRSPRRRRRAVAAATVVLVATGGIAFAVTRNSGSGATTTGGAVATTTAKVTRQDLAKTEQITGTLAYGTTRPIVNQRSGTLTSVPADGSTIDRGGVLYVVDDTPVVLLFGATPAYRELSTASTDGADVQQLKENLTALGDGTLTDDGNFDSATKTALAKFESAAGLDGDGILQLGEVIFTPAAVRVAGSRVDVGATVQPGTTVLDATSTTKDVTATLTSTQADTAKVGTSVSVQLPNGKVAAAKITDVAAVSDATSASSASNANNANNAAAGGGGGGGGGGQPSFTATIALDDPTLAAGYDTSSVTIVVTDASKPGVLTVPVTALVALAEGGYAVQVVDASPAGSHFVKVTPGLYANNQVEISGDLQAGATVVVPA